MLSVSHRTCRKAWRAFGILSLLVLLGTSLFFGLSISRPGGSVSAISHGPALMATPTTSVSVSVAPAGTVSGATVVVAVTVVWNGSNAAGASVALTSSAGGTFSSGHPTTGADGRTNVTFRAPTVTVTTRLEINATSTVSGATGMGSANLSVQASGPYLVVRISFPQGATVHSNSSDLVEVSVQNNTGVPVGGATLTFGTTTGSTSPSSAVSGSTGNVTFTFRPGFVSRPSSAVLLVSGTASGYAGTGAQATIGLRPVGMPPLFVTVKPAQSQISAAELVVISVTVQDNNSSGAFVAGASVALILSDGTYSPGAGTTNSSGVANFIYQTPSSIPAGRTITITASVVAGGFSGGSASTSLTVGAPSTSVASTFASLWWVWTLVVVVAVVVVVVALLVQRGRRPGRTMLVATPTPPTQPPRPPGTG